MKIILLFNLQSIHKSSLYYGFAMKISCYTPRPPLDPLISFVLPDDHSLLSARLFFTSAYSNLASSLSSSSKESLYQEAYFYLGPDVSEGCCLKS